MGINFTDTCHVLFGRVVESLLCSLHERPVQTLSARISVLSKVSDTQKLIRQPYWNTGRPNQWKYRCNLFVIFVCYHFCIVLNVPTECFFCWEISVIFWETFWSLHWNISVICLVVVLKLTITVFISLYFQTFWTKWLNFFRHFKNVSVFDQKNSLQVIPTEWTCIQKHLFWWK